MPDVTEATAEVGQMILQAIQNTFHMGPAEAVAHAQASTGVSPEAVSQADMGHVFDYLCQQPGLSPEVHDYLNGANDSYHNSVHQGGSSYYGGGSHHGYSGSNAEIVHEVTQNYTSETINDDHIDISGPVNGPIDIDEDNTQISDVHGNDNSFNTGTGTQTVVSGDHASNASATNGGTAMSSTGAGTVQGGLIDGPTNTGTFTGDQVFGGSVSDSPVGDGNVLGDGNTVGDGNVSGTDNAVGTGAVSGQDNATGHGVTGEDNATGHGVTGEDNISGNNDGNDDGNGNNDGNASQGGIVGNGSATSGITVGNGNATGANSAVGDHNATGADSTAGNGNAVGAGNTAVTGDGNATGPNASATNVSGNGNATGENDAAAGDHGTVVDNSGGTMTDNSLGFGHGDVQGDVNNEAGAANSQGGNADGHGVDLNFGSTVNHGQGTQQTGDAPGHDLIRQPLDAHSDSDSSHLITTHEANTPDHVDSEQAPEHQETPDHLSAHVDAPADDDHSALVGGDAHHGM